MNKIKSVGPDPNPRLPSPGELRRPAPAPDSGSPPNAVFIRMPPGPGRRLWPGSSLNYWNLRSLISPGPWNNDRPPVRAYALRKPGATRGTVLIENLDLLQWWNTQFQQGNPASAPLPLPNSQLPPVLSIPSSGGQCPVTQLKHTVMYELSLPQSPYGQTRIYVTRYHLPGRAMNHIAMQTQSVLQFIRSFPPPRYKITPRTFTRPPKAPAQLPPATQNGRK